MAYRKKTLRSMSPVARKLARLIGELDSISRRTKNLIEEIQLLEADSRALANTKAFYKTESLGDLPDILTYENTGIGRPE